MQRIRFAGAAFVLLLCGKPARGHHSTAPYDLVHGTVINGTVTKFDWENPHAHIYLDVTGEEKVIEHWTIELDSPGHLRRLGWTKDTVKPGDRITVTVAAPRTEVSTCGEFTSSYGMAGHCWVFPVRTHNARF
jgi:hypothetical protein